MRKFIMVLGIVMTSATSTLSQQAQAPSSASATDGASRRDERLKQIRALPWQQVHDLRLPQSHATITDLSGFAGLHGTDAQTFRSLVDGWNDPTVEGVAIRRKASSELLFSWHEVGYVDARDFSDIDPDKLIESVREATFAGNDDSVRAGQRPITAVDWVRKPTWNESLHTAYWMLQGVHDDGQRTINAIALKLGRRGYEKMIWITSPDQIDRANDLTSAQDAHRYAPGDRYEDHASGDRTAAYGIAGLVAGVIGLKAAKVLGAGALLLVLKKFFVLLLVPFIWFTNKVKSFFRGGGT